MSPLRRFGTIALACICTASAFLSHAAPAPAPLRITVRPANPRQEFHGLGCGVMFYEGHVTSLAARQKEARQRELYDDMFAKIQTRYLNLMIRAEHEQPGCFFTAEAHADLFKAAGEYLAKMAVKFPDVPRAALVGPNTLSAPGAAKDYLHAMQRKAAKYVEVIASHDYDMRGDRWGDLRRLARGKPVWMTEWCAREQDESPGQINSAIEYARAMHEAFTGGANVWMAYDWVYPPRKGGEALIHVDWGNDYELKKPYWLFRQWSAPLAPGMRVVESTAAAAAKVKPTAFVSADGRTLVVHMLNADDAEQNIMLGIAGRAAEPRPPHAIARVPRRIPRNWHPSLLPAGTTPTRCRHAR